jgi:Protein of unknown function (DUF2934)
MVHSRKILTGLSLWCNEIVVSSGVKYSINFLLPEEYMNRHDEIARLAWELYEQSGRLEGRDKKNWHEAERIITATYAGLERADPACEAATAPGSIIREGEESEGNVDIAKHAAPASEESLEKPAAIRKRNESPAGGTIMVTNESTIGTVGLLIKEGVVGSLGALNEMEDEIMNIAKDTVINWLTDSESVTKDSAAVTNDVVRGALGATEEAGLNHTSSIKYVAKGIIFGIHEVGGDIMVAAGHTARSAVSGSAKIGRNVAVVARRTAEGILEATNEMGYDVEEAAIFTIAGAMEAAGEISKTSARAVKDLLVGVERN